MVAHSEFCDYVVDMLAPLGDVWARTMFGGYGIYADTVMFALIADDVLYLKVDDGNRARFEAAGLTPFTYQHRNRSAPVQMSYFQAPPESLENADLLCDWARQALAAALRAQRPRRQRQKKP